MVLVGGKGERRVIVFDKLDGVGDFMFRKGGFEVGEVKLGEKWGGEGIRME